MDNIEITLSIRLNIRLLLIILVMLSFNGPAWGEMTFGAAIEGLEGEALKNVQMALSPPEGMIKEDQIDEILLVLYPLPLRHPPAGRVQAPLPLSQAATAGQQTD